MENRIKEIMSVVFETDLSTIDDTASPETIATWDSIRHMILVAVLEEEFKVVFSDNELLDMLDFKTILQITKNRLV